MDLTDEYAIFDDQGQQFGLPARSWLSKEACQAAFDFLEQRRLQMASDAAEARGRLSFVKSRQARDELISTIARWENEEHRSYRILRRQVSPWQEEA